MEWILEALATFLLEELGQTIQRWSVRFQNLEHDDPEEVELPVNQSTGTFQIRFPSPDYIEAMIGDLLEWQSCLQRQGLSKCQILLATVFAVAQMAIDLLVITLQNVSTESGNSQSAKVADPTTKPEVISDAHASEPDIL